MKKRFLLMVLTISGHGLFLIGEMISYPPCETACNKQDKEKKTRIDCAARSSGKDTVWIFYKEEQGCQYVKNQLSQGQQKYLLSCEQVQEEPCSGWFRLVEKQTEQELLKPTPAANTDTEEETPAAE